MKLYRPVLVVLLVALCLVLPGCSSAKKGKPVAGPVKAAASQPQTETAVDDGVGYTDNYKPDLAKLKVKTYSNPQEQYHEDMLAAENFTKAHGGLPVPLDHPVIVGAREQLSEMVKRGYKKKLVRAYGARFINYYRWAYFEYDKQAERELKAVAKLTGAKYREPKYWAFGREKGWW